MMPLSSRSLFVSLIVLSLSACSIPKFNEPNYVKPIEGAQVVENKTAQAERLICLGETIRNKGLRPTAPLRQGLEANNQIRFAIGRIEDFTGKQDLINGKRITQGAALMAISALGLTRLPMVERNDLFVSETEFKYTDVKLIGENSNNGFRQTFAGSVPGSDFHIIGGITEVNYNIRSAEFEGTFKYFGTSARYAVIDVGIDLRLINTRTLEVISANSFRKQIIGTEIRAGYFRFFNDKFLDINASERAQEPIQHAVRMVIEHSIYKLLLDLYKISPESCDPVSIDPNTQLKISQNVESFR